MVMTTNRVDERVRGARNLDESYPDLCHFLDLVEHAKGNPGASPGEKQALALANSLLENIPGLDASAVRGALTFACIVEQHPETARNIFHGQ